MAETGSPFHRGEQAIQERLGVRDRIERQGRRMIRDHLTEEHQAFFIQLPLLIAGSVDAHGRPWASALVGEPGFIDTSDPRRLTVTTRTVYGDPLDEALVEGAEIGLLGIEFDSRRRNRVNGRVVRRDTDGFEIAVAQSFGNCPKYIQARGYRLGDDISTIGAWRPVDRGAALDKDAAAMIARADTLFIASHFTGDAGEANQGVDVSHRGGKPGFALVAHETLLLIPDYAGNCMFNTLGNIEAEPKCGLLFVDFEGGDTLQLSGEAEILWGAEHTRRFPGAQRVLAFQIDETLQIERALPIAWTFEGYSPAFDKLEPDADDGAVAEQHRPTRLRSVNVSMPKEVVHDGKLVTTGIFKQPVESRVMLRRLNLDGDGQADLWGHGGTFRAVYVYSYDNYAPWAEELGRDDFTYGQFGENF
ncbi:MAG: pyridoxamine 5'-phosphate oxidase family protein, partial [Alphaproteobacteria bacterium]